MGQYDQNTDDFSTDVLFGKRTVSHKVRILQNFRKRCWRQQKRFLSVLTTSDICLPGDCSFGLKVFSKWKNACRILKEKLKNSSFYGHIKGTGAIARAIDKLLCKTPSRCKISFCEKNLI